MENRKDNTEYRKNNTQVSAEATRAANVARVKVKTVKPILWRWLEALLCQLVDRSIAICATMQGGGAKI
jgi:hypothetical protein